MTRKDRLRLGEEFLIEKRCFLLHNEKQMVFACRNGFKLRCR